MIAQPSVFLSVHGSNLPFLDKQTQYAHLKFSKDAGNSLHYTNYLFAYSFILSFIIYLLRNHLRYDFISWSYFMPFLFATECTQWLFWTLLLKCWSLTFTSDNLKNNACRSCCIISYFYWYIYRAKRGVGLSARFFAHLLSRCCIEVPLMKALEPSSSPVPFITFVGHTGMPKCLLVLLTFHTHKRNIIHCLLDITLGLFWSWIGLLFLLFHVLFTGFCEVKEMGKGEGCKAA